NYTFIDGSRDHIRILSENPSDDYPDEISLVPTAVFRAVVAEFLRDLKGPMVYDNGQIARQEVYKNGLRHGEWLLFYEDGARKACWNYSLGQREGRWQWYYQTGRCKKRLTTTLVLSTDQPVTGIQAVRFASAVSSSAATMQTDGRMRPGMRL